MEFDVAVRGQGTVEVAAYGVADAEHLVEKEFARIWSEARLSIISISRPASETARVVEEFAVAYVVDATLRVTADRADDAPKAAFRAARAIVADSRYKRTAMHLSPR